MLGGPTIDVTYAKDYYRPEVHPVHYKSPSIKITNLSNET